MPTANFNGIGIGSGGVAFSPYQLSGLRARYDASVGVYADGGSTPVAADGAVWQWNDLSGNGFHLVQATEANRPAYKTNIIGGKPVLRGNGTSTQMVATGVGTGWPTSEGSVFVVFSLPGTAQYGLMNLSGAANGYWRYGVSGHGFFGLLRNVRLEVQPTAMPSTGSHIYSLTSGAGGYNVYANGAVKLATTASWGISANLTTFFEGTGTGAGYGAVDIAELIIYSREVTAGERSLIHNFLSAKYGVALS